MIAPLRTAALGLLALATAGAAEFDSQIEALLARMTVAEKVGQLTQIGTAPGGGDHRPEHEVLVEQGLIGSLINIHGAAKTNAVQRLAVEKSRLGIPVLFAYDLIHGYRTIFPVPLAEAAS
ncbi:MAG: glycosyl hydrolase, partial [Candidatus Didemnitutus sp.]|nr:glycosyl hydrolase [Candidatus Didemnitutus sp.]